MEITKQKIEKLKQLALEARKMNDFYTKKSLENPSEINKTFEAHYEGKEVGIGAVLDILGIDL